MASLIRLLICFLALAFVGICSADLPRVLVVQQFHRVAKGQDSTVDEADYVAQSLSDGGRVEPIVWSITDPVVRNLVDSGKLPRVIEGPDLADALGDARLVGADYLLLVDSFIDRGAVFCRAFLYRGEALVWQDPDPKLTANQAGVEGAIAPGKFSQTDRVDLKLHRDYRNVAVIRSGQLDESSSLRSIARTWYELMKGGPFKSLISPIKINPVNPSPGQLITSGAIAPNRPVDNSQTFKDVEAAKLDNRVGDAIMILRDAIDAQPFDIALRQALIKLLSEADLPTQAASAATQAALLMPRDNSLRLESARALLRDGNFDAAMNQAKEALARNPKDPEPYIVLGWAELYKDHPALAEEDLNSAEGLQSSAEGLFLRAFSRAMQGNNAGATDDAKLAKIQPNPPSYLEMVQLFDMAMTSAVRELRDVIPALSVQKDADATNATVARLSGKTTAASALFGKLVPTNVAKNSFERRSLAWNLLAQVASELQAVRASSDGTSLTDARINLGEAIRQFEAAKALEKGE